jgi:hypothetical protein
VAHYQKVLAGHTRVELVQVREDEKVLKRIPDRCFTVLLAAESGHTRNGRYALVTPLLPTRPCLGLSLYFSQRVDRNPGWSMIMLDDPVQSMDQGHEEGLRRSGGLLLRAGLRVVAP